MNNTTQVPLKGEIVGYIRVSSITQNTARQLEGIQLDKVFTDKVSGKDTIRPELQRCIEHLRSGDTLIVHSMDRLARNLDDLRKLVFRLTDKGVRVQFIKESLTFTGEDSAMSKLLLSMMGAFAEFERELIRERQREGIATAKKIAGKYKGRVPFTPDKAGMGLLMAGLSNGTPKAELARQLNISRETLYQLLKRLPIEEKQP